MSSCVLGHGARVSSLTFKSSNLKGWSGLKFSGTEISLFEQISEYFGEGDRGS